MDILVGTPQCPHLGFENKHGRPCCRADDLTRKACGRWAPNPARKQAAEAHQDDAFFCAVLGEDALPPEALKLKAQMLRQQREKEKDAGRAGAPKYRAPDEVRGALPARPSREQDYDAEGDADPVIPTHTLRNDTSKVRPNDKCPCGSGKKFKQCCGRTA